jgi:hypothetical protein
MKAKTKAILLDLSGKHSKASLVALWHDLSRLSRGDYEKLLGELTQKPPKKRQTGRPKSSQPQDDRPVTRIAHQLRERLSLSDDEAKNRLSDALISNGVRQELIPSHSLGPLEAWLTNLISTVSETKVMATARRLNSG